MPFKDFKCGNGHVHEELVTPSTMERECPECGELSLMTFLVPSKIDWYGMAMGESAGPEFTSRFDKNHQKQMEKELKHEKEHGLPDIKQSEIDAAMKLRLSK